MSANLPIRDVCFERAAIPTGRRVPARPPALIVSLLLHAGVLLLLLYRIAPQEIENRIRFFPVELVTLADPTPTPQPPKPELPRRQSASGTPQTRKAPPQIVPLPLPEKTPTTPDSGNEPVPLPPKDELQSRLEAFAQLSVPGNGTLSATGNGSAIGPTGYNVRDFVRAQVERRWSVDLDSIANRNATVSIHVVLTPKGEIRTAEIVDNGGADAALHSLALSARNAVILSSPIALPDGTPPSALDMVLTLSPRDALR